MQNRQAQQKIIEPAAGGGKNLAETIRAALDEGKAEDILVFDIARRSALADYMIIAGGTSARHIGALADKLLETLKEAGHKQVKTEGAGSDWLLIDAGDVIVHLFRAEARAFYRLEKMWTERDPSEPAENSALPAR